MNEDVFSISLGLKTLSFKKLKTFTENVPIQSKVIPGWYFWTVFSNSKLKIPDPKS